MPAGLALAAAESAASTGVFAAPLGDGRVSVVAREDLADVAARVAAETYADLSAGDRSRHAGRTYELEGVTAISGEDIATTLSGALGRPVRYAAAALADARAALTAGGLPPYQVTHTVSTFSNIKAGLLEQHGGNLLELLEAPPRPVLDLIDNALKSGGHTSSSATTGP